MTPQVQQVFVPPIAGASASSAALAEVGVDATDGAAAGLDFSFAKLMQTDAAASETKAVAPQTAPLMPDNRAQAAVAIFLQAGVKDLTGPIGVAPENGFALPFDQRDLELVDPASVPNPPVPISAPMIFSPPQLIVPQATDAAGAAQTAAPVQPLPGMALVPTGEPTAPDIPAAAAVPNAAVVVRATDLTVAQASAATARPTAAQTDTPSPAANVGAAPITPPLLAAAPNPAANPVMVADGSVQQPADILSAPPPAAAPKPARATPAETAFRLRAGGADSAVLPEGRAISVPLPERNPPQVPAAPGEPFAAVVPPDPAADTPAGSDKPTLPPIGPLSDPPVSPATHGQDAARPTPTAVAQIAAPPAANLPAANLPAANLPAATPAVATPLPPRVTADLVTLAKTQPNGPIQILLNPAELGNLRFEIHQNADQLRVVLAVERPETMDLLRRNADQLLGEFRAAGFAGASLSFGQWDQHNGQQRNAPTPPAPQPPPHDRAFAPPQLPAKPTHSSPEMAASSGLNLRL